MATQIKKKNDTKVKETELNNDFSNEEIKNEEVVVGNEETNETQTDFTSSMQEKDNKISELEADNADKDKQISELTTNIDTLQKSFELLQQQMQQLMTLNTMGTANKSVSRDVLVGCRALYGSVLADTENKYVYKFDCDEQKYVDSDDLNYLFKSSGLRDNKRMFEKDELYFVNPEDYETFKVKKRVDLSHDNLVRILSLPAYEMINEINKMTDNLVDFQTVHNIQYEICKIMINENDKLVNWRYENRIELEKYFRQKFDDLLASIGAVEIARRVKIGK